MIYAAILIFAIAYILMLVFSKYRPYIALAAAVVFIITGMLPFGKILDAIDFNVILMIAGTMGIVALFIESKMPELLADLIMEKAPYLHHFFFITDLMHLKRGGRISAATAAVGTLLKARLVCTVLEDGKLSVVDKAVGTKKALKCLVDNLEDFGEDLTNQTIYICHSDDFHNAELLKAFVIKQVPRAKIIINNIGPVIGSHTGPDTIGIVFLGKHRSKLVKGKSKHKDKE